MVMFRISSKDFQNQVYRTINTIQMQLSGAKPPKEEFKPQTSTNIDKSFPQKTAEPDFGPYMRELQKRIKANWKPPKGNESKRVIVLFKVAKNGKLLQLKFLKHLEYLP